MDLSIFDYLEANAPQLWRIPRFELAEDQPEDDPAEEPFPWMWEGDSPQEESSSPLAAAYEGVVFRESALDGVDSDLLERKFEGVDSELAREVKRLSDHLLFVAVLGALWEYTAFQLVRHRQLAAPEHVSRWAESADRFCRELRRLFCSVFRYPMKPDSTSVEDLSQYGLRLHLKDVLLQRILEAWTKMEEARWALRLLVPEQPQPPPQGPEIPFDLLRRVYRTALGLEKHGFSRAWKELLKNLHKFPWSVPPPEALVAPEQIVHSRTVIVCLGRLLSLLPRIGRLEKALELIRRLPKVEKQTQSAGPQISQIGLLFMEVSEALARAVVLSADSWSTPSRSTRKNYSAF